MDQLEQCPLCGLTLTQQAQDFEIDVFLLDCKRCGNYTITWEAAQDIKRHSPFLQAAARQAWDKGQYLRIRTDNWERLIAEHQHTGVLENTDNLLS